MADRINVYLPVARFVSGSLTQKRSLNARKQPIPEEKQQFEFGLALRKDSPDAQAFWGQLINGFKQAFAHNPNVHPIIDQWLQNGFQGFSGKVADGDKPNAQGAVNENTKGCWVIYCSTSYPPVCADETNAQIDPSRIERGYFVDATLSVAPNSNAIGDGIGCYVNPDMIRLRAVGEVIRGGIDTATVGASMPMGSLPQGAAPVGQGAVGGAPMPGMGQPAPQQPAAAPTAAPTAPAPTAAPPQMPGAGTGQPAPAMPGTQTGSGSSYPPHTGVLPS